MEFLMNLPEAVARDMGINFSRGDGGMAEEFLNDAQVSAVFKQVGRETMAEHVRGDVSRNSGAADPLFDTEPESHGGERSAAPGKKNVRRRARRDKFGSADGNVTFERGDGLFAQWKHALFVAFADDVDEASFQMKLFKTNAAQFGQTKAGGVRQFENGLIAEGLRSFRSFGHEKLFDLLTGEGLGKSFPSAREGKSLSNIRWEKIFVFGEAVEGAESGDFEIYAFAAEAARRIFRLIGERAFALVLEEGD